MIIYNNYHIEINRTCTYFPGDELFTPLERKHGLPIGNLTSQFFANLYLSGFDHFVKETLQVKCYLRYVDDFSLFAGDRSYLIAAQKAIDRILQSRQSWFAHLAHGHTWQLRQKISATL